MKRLPGPQDPLTFDEQDQLDKVGQSLWQEIQERKASGEYDGTIQLTIPEFENALRAVSTLRYYRMTTPELVEKNDALPPRLTENGIDYIPNDPPALSLNVKPRSIDDFLVCAIQEIIMFLKDFEPDNAHVMAAEAYLEQARMLLDETS